MSYFASLVLVFMIFQSLYCDILYSLNVQRTMLECTAYTTTIPPTNTAIGPSFAQRRAATWRNPTTCRLPSDVISHNSIHHLPNDHIGLKSKRSPAASVSGGSACVVVLFVGAEGGLSLTGCLFTRSNDLITVGDLRCLANATVVCACLCASVFQCTLPVPIVHNICRPRYHKVGTSAIDLAIWSPRQSTCIIYVYTYTCITNRRPYLHCLRMQEREFLPPMLTSTSTTCPENCDLPECTYDVFP